MQQVRIALGIGKPEFVADLALLDAQPQRHEILQAAGEQLQILLLGPGDHHPRIATVSLGRAELEIAPGPHEVAVERGRQRLAVCGLDVFPHTVVNLCLAGAEATGLCIGGVGLTQHGLRHLAIKPIRARLVEFRTGPHILGLDEVDLHALRDDRGAVAGDVRHCAE